MNSVNLKKEWITLLDQRNFTLAVTLTYDKSTTDNAANRDLAHLYQRVYSTIYRNRPNKPLSFAAFLEHTTDGTPHWHILFEPIESKTNESQEQARERLCSIVTKTWMKMRNTPFSTAGIHTTQIYGKAGIIEYVLKTSDHKHHFDFVVLDYTSPFAIAV